MATVNSEFVERYQIILEKDPESRVFAPLSEAYRKMGLLDQAIEVSRKGVGFHPNFASGRVALARALMEKESFTESIEHLKEATKLSPENLLAHKLLAKVLIQNRQPAEALKAYKMALFLNPTDSELQRNVQKWEFLMAIEFEDDLFEVVDSAGSSLFGDGPWDAKRVEKITSLADAFTVREELNRAIKLLEFAESQTSSSSISKRLKILKEKSARKPSEPKSRRDRLKQAIKSQSNETSSHPTEKQKSKKKDRLERLFHKIKKQSELTEP